MTIFYLSDTAWSQSILGLNSSMAIFFSVTALSCIITAVKSKLE